MEIATILVDAGATMVAAYKDGEQVDDVANKNKGNSENAPTTGGND
jgi:hypothetical protein